MRSSITISGKTIIAAIAREIRNVMSIAEMHTLGLRLDARFLLQRLVGLAAAHRVTVPVYRWRAGVGVTSRSHVQMAHRHLRRVTGRCRRHGSWDVGSRGF